MNKLVIALTTFAIAACGDRSDPETITTNPPPSTIGIRVSDIQGSGDSSPMTEQTVSFTAIVSGDFQENDSDTGRNLGGFYVQQESSDGDVTTSDGVFVFDGDNPSVDVRVGDRVEIRGTVKEFFGETQISATAVRVTGTGTIQATDVDLPVNSLADLEHYEGMLLRFPQQLTVTNLRSLGRFGAVGLSHGGRLYQFTNGNSPDSGAYTAHQQSTAARSIVLDDGLRSSYPSSIRYLNAGAGADYSIRNGDSVTGLTGNLRFSRGSGGRGDEAWRLMPTETVTFDDDNLRPGTPNVAGSIRVAGVNVLNFFSKVDNGQAVCGPQRDDNCRGADSARELARQLAKTASGIALMDADIVGLVELENNASESISAIVEALNATLGGGNYAYVNTGVIGDDAIKTGFIYNVSTVQLLGSFALLDSSVDPRFNDNRNRPALAQSFEVTSTGAVFTVVVNHLKSKGSSCDSNGDPNRNDGQGNCSVARTNAAAAIADWIDTDPTGSGDTDFLIIGDLNAYLREDPLDALRNAGFTSLLEGGANPYSFVFDAQAGALDHALASASLLGQVRETIEWHVNADEPQLLDYNLENGRDPGLFDPASPYRSSDHDPIIVGLDPVNQN